MLDFHHLYIASFSGYGLFVLLYLMIDHMYLSLV